MRVRTGNSILVVAALAVLGGGIAAPARPQDGGSGSGASAQQVFSEMPQSVTIYFAARDNKGKIVTDLKADELKLTVDGVPQKIGTFIAPAEAPPLTFELLLDVSGSRRGELPGIEQKYAYTFFTTLLRPGDLAYVREFADISRLLAISSADPDVLAKAVSHESQGYGPTALFQAVYEACIEDLAHNERRKTILVITDGINDQPNDSRHIVENCLRKENVVVYALRPIHPSDARSPIALTGLKMLGHFAEYSGGYVWPVADEKGFMDALASVVQQIRGQYTIVFAGPGPKPKDKPRKIELKTSRKAITLFAPENMPGGRPIGP